MSMKEQKPSEQGTSQGRRHFLKGSAAVAPVVITVASRPVLGAQCTPSAWVSGNLSDHGNFRTSCGGFNPTYWASSPSLWPAPYKPGTKFNDVFTLGNGYYDGKTLLQVLSLTAGEDPYGLGKNIVAALLNAASVTDYGMDVATVQEIYKQLVLNGIYQPSSGDPMIAQDVVAFIQNTYS
jgi:hypothetical protein